MRSYREFDKIYGQDSGFHVEYDLKDPEQRNKAMPYVWGVAVPILLLIIVGVYLIIFSNHWYLSIPVLFVGVFAILVSGVNIGINQALNGVDEEMVTYHIDTLDETFEVKDKYGRDVTDDYMWTVDWVGNRYGMHDGAMERHRYFRIKKINDSELGEPEIVDDAVIEAKINELYALRYVILGIAACFTYIPFLPVVVMAMGEKKYPNTSYFAEKKGMTFKGFAWIWSITILACFILIGVLMKFVFKAF